MIPEYLIESIEGITFSAFMNAASGFRVFVTALEDSEEIAILVDYLRERPEHMWAVHERVLAILDIEPTEYMHPHDVAVSGYLFALRRVDLNIAYRTAWAALATPNLFWARHLAEQVVQQFSSAAVTVSSTQTTNSALFRFPLGFPIQAGTQESVVTASEMKSTSKRIILAGESRIDFRNLHTDTYTEYIERKVS